MNWISKRWTAFWLGADYWASNVLWDDPDITISSKVAEARDAGKWWGKAGCKVLNVLFLTQDHCSGAVEHDQERASAAVSELQAQKEKEAGDNNAGL